MSITGSKSMPYCGTQYAYQQSIAKQPRESNFSGLPVPATRQWRGAFHATVFYGHDHARPSIKLDEPSVKCHLCCRIGMPSVAPKGSAYHLAVCEFVVREAHSSVQSSFVPDTETSYPLHLTLRHSRFCLIHPRREVAEVFCLYRNFRCIEFIRCGGSKAEREDSSSASQPRSE